MLLLDRDYSEQELNEVHRITGHEETVLAMADFSPGPWWGFNGIQTLVVTSNHLHVVQRGVALTRGRLRKSVPTDSIRAVEWHVRRLLGREAVRMTVTADGWRSTFTSKYRQGVEVAKTLAQYATSG
jgi:hypothetical protein